MRVFKNSWFMRFARKETISDSSLVELVRQIEEGKLGVDLGGGVYKQRLGRHGDGKSGGYRIIICFRRGERAFFVYGFPKSDRENITKSELAQFKKLAKILFAMTDEQLNQSQAFQEIQE